MSKKIVKIIGIAILVAGALLAGCQMLGGSGAIPNGDEASAALTAVIARGHIEETVSATGSVAGNEQASLGFASNGRISEALVVGVGHRRSTAGSNSTVGQRCGSSFG